MMQQAMSLSVSVSSLLFVYDTQVRKRSSIHTSRTYAQAGSKSRLVKKMQEIIDYCTSNDIDPVEFLLAQFSLWSPANRYAASYPTVSYLGVTPACIKRYEAWKNKTPLQYDDNIAPVINDVLRMNGFTNEDEIFDHVALIRLLPPAYVKAHPSFKDRLARGFYNSFRAQLAEYL